MQPLVDIVLLNHNTWRHTIECLESVLRSDYPRFRVIISDNLSTNDSLERIRAWLSGIETFDASAVPFPMRDCVAPPVAKPIAFVEGDAGAAFDTGRAPVVILRGASNAGFAGGNNAALNLILAERRAAFAWILNNDTVVAPDCLSRMVETITADDRIGAVGNTILEYGAPEVVQVASGGTISCTTGRVVRANQSGVARSSVDQHSTDYNFVTCCSLLARCTAFESAGLLDERFFIYTEDGDFGLRLSAAGWKLGYAAAAVIWHKGSTTTVSGSPFNDYHHIRSCLLFVHKWRPARLPAAFAYWLYRGLAPKLVRRQWTRAEAVIRAFRDAIRAILPA
jgi:GT2 family glycosyltransferase